MKNILIILTAALLTASCVFAQEETIQTDSLQVKYESQLRQLETEINDIVFKVAMNDPAIVQRLNQLLLVVPDYNAMVGRYNTIQELLKTMTPESVNAIKEDSE